MAIAQYPSVRAQATIRAVLVSSLEEEKSAVAVRARARAWARGTTKVRKRSVLCAGEACALACLGGRMGSVGSLERPWLV